MSQSKKEAFLSAFATQDFSQDIANSKVRRDNAIQKLENLSFPTSKTEYWKYTRLQKLLNNSFKVQESDEETAVELSIPSKNCLVFINGFYRKDLSWTTEAKGVSFMSLSEAKESGILHPKFDSLSKVETEIFSAINTAYHQNGGYLHLKKGTACEDDFYIIHFVNSDNVICNPRNFFYAEEGSSAKVVVKTISDSSGVSFTNMLSEIFVESKANFEINKVQQQQDIDFQIAQEEVWQADNSNFKINTFCLDGGLIRNNLNIDLQGERTETWLNGLYLGSEKQHFDNHTFVNHAEPNCESHELYKGILNEQSTGVFNGKVFVNQKAQKTNAYQSNANLLLTDEATVNSKPELEIYADDVKCSHGSTTGQLDEEAMFYLRSRGMSERSAKAVLVNAFAADVLEHIGVDSVKEEIEQYIDNYTSV